MIGILMVAFGVFVAAAVQALRRADDEQEATWVLKARRKKEN